MAAPVRRVVNASPLILLAKIGSLDFLRTGVPEVHVPDAVWGEVGARGPGDAAFQEIPKATWLQVVSTPPIPPLVRAWDLGAGESSVIAVAIGDPNFETILDDRDARRCAGFGYRSEGNSRSRPLGQARWFHSSRSTCGRTTASIRPVLDR